jgi:hypothetical protein
MSDRWRISAMVSAALLVSGLALLGCPGTLAKKECFLQEERARSILVGSCLDATCHNAKDKVVGLDLETGGISTRLSGKAALCKSDLTLITPGDPEASLLYTKLGAAPPCGSRMPLARPELYPEDLVVIEAWIKGLDGSCADAAATTSGSGGSGGASSSSSGGTGGASSSSSGSGGSGGTGGTGGTGGM